MAMNSEKRLARMIKADRLRRKLATDAEAKALNSMYHRGFRRGQEAAKDQHIELPFDFLTEVLRQMCNEFARQVFRRADGVVPYAVVAQVAGHVWDAVRTEGRSLDYEVQMALHKMEERDDLEITLSVPAMRFGNHFDRYFIQDIVSRPTRTVSDSRTGPEGLNRQQPAD
jgi:hypothetical protein